MGRAWVAAVGALVLIVSGAGEGAAQECRDGEAAVGWVGIEGVACNCTLTTGPVPVWSFRSEPRILGIEDGSRADGVLRPGDLIVAVNGDLITTSEAGRAFGALRPGQPLRFTVRRDGRTMDVTLTPAPLCGDDPRATPPTPWPGNAGTHWPALPRRAPQPPPGPPAVLPRTPAPVIPAPPTQPAPLAPPPAVAGRSGGWFGFGISCSQCSWELEGDTAPRWTFVEYPRLFSVEEGSPAYEAGLRTGDELLRIDGIGLRTEEGGRRFGGIRPGQRVRWTYRRDGQEGTIEVQAARRPGPIVPRTPRPEGFRAVRFQDTVGNVEVEVLGGPGVVTTIVEEGRYLIIDTGDARIRLRVTGATAGRGRDR